MELSEPEFFTVTVAPVQTMSVVVTEPESASVVLPDVQVIDVVDR